ncbi:hypothetical protein JMUB7547_28510 [Staphylococcus aureus]
MYKRQTQNKLTEQANDFRSTAGSEICPVSYTHLTLPTKLEV